eukprot:2979690-Prymnesium_polylepis.1
MMRPPRVARAEARPSADARARCVLCVCARRHRDHGGGPAAVRRLAALSEGPLRHRLLAHVRQGPRRAVRPRRHLQARAPPRAQG